MLENNSPVSDDETDSELYEDALDKEPSREKLIVDNVTEELLEAKSSLCIIPFKLGVYSQFLEARIVLSNNFPKCDRDCVFPERRNLHCKKLEETVLTCHIANKNERKTCPVCCRKINCCICGKAFIQSKSSNSSQKKKNLCTVCRAPPTKCMLSDPTKSKTKTDNTDIISLLRDISRIPIPQKNQNKFTSHAVAKSATNNGRISVKCDCKELEKTSPSYLSKLSYFSSEELQLVHSIRGSKLTETLKQKQCIFCDKVLGSCICGSLKVNTASGKCKFCGKINACCVCPRWKTNLRRKDSMNICTIPPTKDKLRCICERKTGGDTPKIAGTIDEIKVTKPKSQTLSTPSLGKKPDTTKSTSQTPLKTIREGKKTESNTPKIEDKGGKGHKSNNKKDEIHKEKPPSAPTQEKIKQPSSSSNSRPPEDKKPQEPRKSQEPAKVLREPEKPSTQEQSAKKKEEKKQEPDNREKTQKTQPGNDKDTKISKQPEDKKVENVVKPKSDTSKTDNLKSVKSKTEEKKIENADRPERQQDKKDRQEDIRKPEQVKKPEDPKKFDKPKQPEKKIPDESKKPQTPEKTEQKKVEDRRESDISNRSEQKKVEDRRKSDISNRSEQKSDSVVRPSTPKQSVCKNKKAHEDVTPEKSQNIEPEDGAQEKVPKRLGSVSKPGEQVKPEAPISTDKEVKPKTSIGTDKQVKPETPIGADKQVKPRTSIGTDKDVKPETPIATDKPKMAEVTHDESVTGSRKVSEHFSQHEDEKIADTDEEIEDFQFVEPDITITIELSDKEDEYKLSFEEKGKSEVEEAGDKSIPESMKEGKTCQCKIDKLPELPEQKCKPCKTKCKKCSLIPKSTSRIIPRGDVSTDRKKLCHCCNTSTNTQKAQVTDKGEQWETATGERVLLCKKCRQNRANSDKVTSVSNNGRIGNMKRSSTFVCSTKDSTISKGCCKRPSTASKINERRNQEVNEVQYSCEETVVQICHPCSELPLLSSERTCPRQVSTHQEFPQGKICHCHAKVNTDRENLEDKGQQCLGTPRSRIKCKECSQTQTGGTLEQDIISSYVACCTSKEQRPPPQEFIIQTLLYQFAGYELNKDPSPPRRRRSLDRPKTQAHGAMRSIQVQVGPTRAPKCEAAQTVTTFILTDPPTGKVNYVCGPDVPGIRTKVAMNLNQIPSVQEDTSCVCAPECMNEQEGSFDQCQSSICSYFHNSGSPANYKVTKKDKYVFITVTPVQTDPYEPNYYIVFSTPEDELKDTKSQKICSKSKQNKSSSKKDPLDRFKNQIFSLETLKSKEFLEFYESKKDFLQNAKVMATSCDPGNPICVENLMEKTKKIVEDKNCGPDTCEFLKAPPKKQASTCCFGDDEVTTKSVACGSEHCFHQVKLDQSKNAQVSPSKDAQCGPDICNFKKNKDASTGDKICVQEEEKNKNKTSSKAVIVRITCDACTSTDSGGKKNVNAEYCDKKVCTNECEKGDVASQVCLEKEPSGTVRIVHKYCDASCNPTSEDVEETNSLDESSDVPIEEKTAENDTKSGKLKECDDKVCPEKTTKSTDNLNDFYQAEDRDEECADAICPMKNVSTKLDDHDVFALELAMNRFIKVNPKSMKEDD